jgi:hypothetical protein
MDEATHLKYVVQQRVCLLDWELSIDRQYRVANTCQPSADTRRND